MIRYCPCRWRCGQTLGLWMLPVVVIPGRWSIKPLTFRRVIGCFTSAPFTAPIISGSFLPSFMLSPSVGIRVCTIRLSILIRTTPSFGSRNANARPNWSVRHRQKSSIKSFCELNNGSTHTISETPSLSGKPPNGERFPLTSEENKKIGIANAVPILFM